MSQLLAERYEAVRLLGSGAMGEVWLANDTLLGRQVAIKRILPTPALAADPTLVERMIREARLAATVQSPHIVSVFDLVRDSAGIPHVIMEFVEGESVAALLARLGRCEPRVAATLMAGVCQALVTAHGKGVVHRDIKPANLLIDRRGQVKLADFGIARALGGADAGLTGTGQVVGTVLYMAPEVALGEQPSYPADLYAVGATLFALTEGLAPLATVGSDEATASQLLRLVSQPAPDPVHAGPLTSLICRLLARDPATRPDASTAADYLAAVAADRAPAPLPALTTTDEGAPDRGAGPTAHAHPDSDGLTISSLPTQRRSSIPGQPGTPSAGGPTGIPMLSPAAGPAGGAAPPARSRARTWLFSGLAVGLLVVAGAAALALSRGGGDGGQSPQAAPVVVVTTTVPAPTPTPTPNPTTVQAATVTVTATVDPENAALQVLQDLYRADQARLRLDGRWIVQLSSKWKGITDLTQTAANGGHVFQRADILAEHQQLRAEFPGVMLLQATDIGRQLSYPSKPAGEPLWVTVADLGSTTTEAQAESWCRSAFPGLSGDALRNVCLPREADPPHS